MNKNFFGMMFQSSSVHAGGVVQEPYFPITYGVQRLWDTFATQTFMGTEPPFNLQPLEDQCALAERNGAKVLFTFGFSGDEHFPPPAAALKAGSRNRPDPDYLRHFTDALLDFSLAGGEQRIQMYELANEPAIADLYWDGSSMEERVLAHYEHCVWLAHYIRARDPKALILGPSFNDLLEPTGYDFALRFCRLMRERGMYWDGTAFHAYCKTKEEADAHLAALDHVTEGLWLDFFCTEFNGPWEVFDLMARRGDIKLVTLNGQQRAPLFPAPPYEDQVMAQRWNAMVTRITTAGPILPPPPVVKKGKGGCLFFWVPWVMG